MDKRSTQNARRKANRRLAGARGSAEDFRLEQLTRALHIALRSIKGTDAMAMNAKSIARHALDKHGVKGDIWSLPQNDKSSHGTGRKDNDEK